MAKSTERKQRDLNTFQDRMETLEKETVKEMDIYSNLCTASIAYIDEDVANIHEEVIMTVATSMESAAGSSGGMKVESVTMNVDAENDINCCTASTSYDKDENISNIRAEASMIPEKSMETIFVTSVETKTSNPDIGTALNSSLETDGGEGTSSGIGRRASLAERQLAASVTKDIIEDVLKFGDRFDNLSETIFTSSRILHLHSKTFSEKALKATKSDTEHSRIVADSYNDIASEYLEIIKDLEKEQKSIYEAKKKCFKYAERADTADSLDRSIRKKLLAAIIVFLEKEHALFIMIERVWCKVQSDLKDEKINEQAAENKDRKIKIGHIIATILGLALLSITGLFTVGSDSFYAILALGLLTTVWCAGYWSHKLYKCKKKSPTQTEEERLQETDVPRRFLRKCNLRLKIAKKDLQKYIALYAEETKDQNLDTESDSVPSAHEVETFAIN